MIKATKKIHYERSFFDILVSIITYILYGAFAIICIYPFYYIFVNTISSNVLSAKGSIIFWPKEIHFQNYIDATHIPGLLNAALISIGRTVIGTVLTVFATAFLGYLFTIENLWHKKFWYRYIIITMYFNAGIIPWYITMRNLHMTNNFLAYILPGIVAPFNIILAKTFIENIPKELEQAAEIDGAGTIKLFTHVILPVIKPILATVAIFTAVGQWNSFQDTLLLMTEDKLYSLQYILYQYINQASSLKSIISSMNSTSNIAQILATAQTTTSIRMTVTIIVVAPILLMYPLFQKNFVKGIMIGAVKG
ncbi:MAG TPA: carbohydrate ABC transporter permease [Lachnospiraceae bacterium]|nr:carbohydrate ABC transporter permease [Lachnospiraceae bacterium]